jgi:glycosyltransferase involved in cell wall biosynthesis
MYLKKTVAVIIPVSDEKNLILPAIQELDATSYPDEIIVVDRGATAETIQLISKTRAKIVSRKGAGIGAAVKSGIKNTKADLIIVTAADGSFRGQDIIKLLSYSDEFDMVFGSRTHVPLLIGKNSGMTFLRRLLDDIFGKMISIIFLSSNITDVGCTFRLTNRKALSRIMNDCKSGDEFFFIEWLISAAKNKVRFVEVPVNFNASKGYSNKNKFIYLAVRAIKILFLIPAFAMK